MTSLFGADVKLQLGDHARRIDTRGLDRAEAQ
jgi:hypothetical protein